MGDDIKYLLLLASRTQVYSLTSLLFNKRIDLCQVCLKKFEGVWEGFLLNFEERQRKLFTNLFSIHTFYNLIAYKIIVVFDQCSQSGLIL